MESVNCTLDAKSYFANKFAESDAMRNPELRKSLVCPRCGAKAFYRRASSRTSACFFSKHEVDCYVDTAVIRNGESSLLSGPGREIGRIRILPLGALVRKRAELITPNGKASLRAFRRGTGRARDGQRTSTRSYGSILDELTVDEGFQHSSYIIEPFGYEPMPASRFFVHADLIDDSCVGEFHGYWGTIAKVKPQGDGAWLNLGKGYSSVGFMLPMDMYEEAGRRFRFNSPEELVGSTLLYVGELSNRYSLRIQDLSKVCIRVPR